MAGTLVADDIQHSTAGSVGTEYVVQGSAKSWVNFNGTGTVSVRDSLNVSSITDHGTANYGPNFSSAFSNADFSASGSALKTTNSYYRICTERDTTNARSTTRIRWHTGHASLNNEEDCVIVTCDIHGDLA